MKNILSLLTFLLSSFSFGQIVLSTLDTAALTENDHMIESIYNPSWGEDIDVAILQRCEPVLYGPAIETLYSHFFSQSMIENDQDYVILHDTSKTDTAYTLKKDENGAFLTKYYHNGNVIQQGYLTTLKQENIRYDFSEIGSSNSTYWREWIDSVYVGRAIAIGHWKNYYENGKLASEGEHMNRVEISIRPILGPDMSTYYEMTIYDYTFTFKIGEWSFYDETGRLVLHQQFEQGTLVGMGCMPEE